MFAEPEANEEPTYEQVASELLEVSCLLSGQKLGDSSIVFHIVRYASSAGFTSK